MKASATTTTPCCARFLDTFGFEYEFASATDYYKSGKFDEILLRAPSEVSKTSWT
jgi:lysyl-tRNA synthetase class 1